MTEERRASDPPADQPADPSAESSADSPVDAGAGSPILAGDGVDLPAFHFDLELESEDWMERIRAAEKPCVLGTLGAFELLQEVGRGGQGVVYRAWDTRTRRQVAVKRLVAGSFASVSARSRFEQEVEAAASLNHPGIVTVFGVEGVDGEPVLSMEWIDGVAIHDWARGAGRAAPSAREVVELFVQVGEALHHAHQRGVLHRDLKPSNVLVDAAGKPHILDFGLAKVSAPDARGKSLTLSGHFLGTPAYASPEQIRSGPVAQDVRSDLYSLGVMFYEALTGTMPYPVGNSIADAFDAIEKTEPRRFGPGEGSLERDLEAIVLRTLEKAPGRRYQSVHAFLEDVRRYLRGDPVEAQGHGLAYVAGKLVRRHKLAVGVAAAFCALAVGFSVTMTVLFNRAEREAARTQRVQAFLESALIPEASGTSVIDYRLVDVLEAAVARIDEELGDEPEIEGRVRARLSSFYAKLWLWEDVEKQARLAIPLQTAVHGEDSEAVAWQYYLLGNALAFRNDPEAVAVAGKALAIRQRIHEPGALEIATAWGGVGFANWRGAHDPGEAERAYRRALAMFESTAGDPDAPWVSWAGVAYGFGAFLWNQQRAGEARPVFERAIELYRKLPESLDVHLVRCLQDYGHVLYATKDWEAAERALAEVASRAPKAYAGTVLPISMWRLGQLYERRGMEGEAWDCYRETLALGCRIAARKRPEVGPRLRLAAERIAGEGVTHRLFREIVQIAGSTDVEWHPSLEEMGEKFGVPKTASLAPSGEPTGR